MSRKMAGSSHLPCRIFNDLEVQYPMKTRSLTIICVYASLSHTYIGLSRILHVVISVEPIELLHKLSCIGVVGVIEIL